GTRRLPEYSRAQLEPQLGTAPPQVWSTWGNLHLKSGLAAARRGDGDTADVHWAHAQEAAAHAWEQDDYRWRWAPPTWPSGCRARRRTLRRHLASTLPPTTPHERRGHHYIDLTRGYQLHGDRDNALRAFNPARR